MKLPDTNRRRINRDKVGKPNGSTPSTSCWVARDFPSWLHKIVCISTQGRVGGGVYVGGRRQDVFVWGQIRQSIERKQSFTASWCCKFLERSNLEETRFIVHFDSISHICARRWSYALWLSRISLKSSSAFELVRTMSGSTCSSTISKCQHLT